jgi:hypothetical protein
MSKSYIHVLILASSIDGYQQIEEQLVIENYKKNFPAFKEFSEEAFIDEARSISAKIMAGMKVEYIINDIGEELDQQGKNIAYALAAEVCASNFEIVPPETNLLKRMSDTWKIDKKIKDSINTSIKLRYGIDN